MTEFLQARIAEDEAVAREDQADLEREFGKTGAQLFSPLSNVGVGYMEYPAISIDNTRVLAECEAKRRIVERHAARGGAEDWMDDDWLSGMSEDERRGHCGWCTYDNRVVQFPCADLHSLASIYADHPDFREEWRVSQTSHLVA